ncbi:MAG: rhamnan synthesis F family protein, partial [Firmicutes bacterium]|nr:rhamnan synthesis F family protein [Bacillota bacterium]
MNRLVLFAHFDAENRIRPYILFHLKALRELGARIHFISNSALPEEETRKLQFLAERVLLRENEGLDFGMWQAALRNLDRSTLDELILTNSSIVGPLFPLEPIFQRMDANGADLWAMTESREHAPHLQTFFVVFRRSALRAQAFEDFFRSVLPYRAKMQVVRAFEVGLSIYLQEQGLTWSAAFPGIPRCGDLWANLRIRKSLRHRPKKNPTLLYADQLLEAGMPYVKTMLLAQNPYKLRLQEIQRMMEQRG